VSELPPAFTPPEPNRPVVSSQSSPSFTYPPPLPPAPQGPRKKFPALAIVGIVVGAVLLVAALIGAVVFVVFAARTVSQASFTSGGDLDPVIVGVPGPTSAVDPLECSDNCFGDEVFAELVADHNDLRGLGMTVNDYSFGDLLSSDTSVEYEQVLRYWNEEKVSPENCFFSYFTTPVSTPYAPRNDGNKDHIEYIQGLFSADEYSTLNTAARTFETSAAATEHMESLFAQVNSCDTYELPETEDTFASETTVTTPAGLYVPMSVAAVGWVESSEFGRFYAFDLQRGNLVVRYTVSTDGVISESSFRSFVGAQALQISRLSLPEDASTGE
jgi:hypothetical protein